MEIYIDVSLIKNYPKEKAKENYLPQTQCIRYFMVVSMVNRLLTYDDVEELLIRITMLMKRQKLLENYFLTGKWEIDFKFKNEEYVLTVDDIINHFGIIASDHYKAFNSREGFVSRLRQTLKNVVMIEALSDIKVITENIKKADKKVDGYSDAALEKFENDAAFLAKDILKNIPGSAFKQTSGMKEKLKEYKEREDHVLSMPKFELSKLDPELVDMCMDIMLELNKDNEAYVKYMTKEKLMYFAWLYANDLMEVDYYNIIVDEAYLDFDENDYNWYEPEMVCWNDFVEEHNMKEVVPLLKGLLF